MSRAILSSLAFGAALLIGLPALAETVRTKDGQRLVGTIVEETQAELVLRTKYGVLVIPADRIEGVDGRPGEAAKPAATAPAAEAPPLDLAKLRALRLKARRQAQTSSSADAALATYAELLALEPDDAEAHLEVAALRARRGEAQDAVAALRKALLAGLVDADRLRGPDFARLEPDPAFQRLLADRVGLVRIAARRAPLRLVRDLRARGARASYASVFDEARRLSYVHALKDDAFASVRAEVEALAKALREEPFTGEPEGPLHIVLVAEQDEAALGGAAATYDRPGHVLTLAPLPFGTLSRAPAAQRELVRALLVADERARRQRHPAWLVEGVVELYGTAAREGAGLAPRHSALLATITTATPWGGALTRDPRERGARLAARSVAHYALTQGALGRLWDGLAAVSTATAPDAGAALAAALGPDAEAGWRAWLAAQKAPALPFPGWVASPTARGLRISYVQAESGAARANLAEGDVVTAVDGLAVRSEDDLSEALSARKAGDQVLVDLARDERALRVRLTLGVRPAGRIGPMREKAPYFGVSVEQAQGGVTVTAVDADSPAAKAGLQPGDLVTALDGEPIATVRAWLRALRAREPGQRVELAVDRAGARRTLQAELGRVE